MKIFWNFISRYFKYSEIKNKHSLITHTKNGGLYNLCFLLTLKVPEKLLLYGLYVYYYVHICDFGMLRVNSDQLPAQKLHLDVSSLFESDPHCPTWVNEILIHYKFWY